MDQKSTQNDLQFLAGGGEMGELTRKKDWTETSLGAPENWPQSLRTTLSILLNSKFPMFLWWGKDLICFYNDAYRPSLGQHGKHPSILGMKAEQAWPEIWDTIQPLINQVLTTGKATWNEDTLIPIYRNGHLEDVYWTFSYSPVNDESGKPAGVFVTCSETTAHVLAFNKLNESNKTFLNSMSQAPIAMCVLRGENLVIEMANGLMLQLWEKENHQVINKPYFEALPETKGQGLETMLENVYKTGKTFAANERAVDLMRNGKIETTYLNFVCEALKDAEGNIYGIIGTAIEVTKEVLSRKKLEETEQKVRALVENAPFAIAVYTGEEMRVELANQAIIDIWGKGNDVIGKTFTEILPELAGQSVFEQIKDVYATGKAFHTQNTPLDLVVNGKKGTYYFNYDFTPLYDLSGKIYGVMNTGIDLTDLSLAKQKIEESDSRFRRTVQQAPVGITILRGKEYIAEMANDAYLQLVDRKASDFLHKPLFESLPEVKEAVQNLLDDVMETGIPYHGNESPIPLVRGGVLGTYYFDFLYHPLREDDGSISGIIVTVTEVTEKVQSRKKIERNEERLNIVIEASELGTWELNLKTREAIYSPRYFEIISGSKEFKQLTHEQLIQFLHPDDLGIREKALQDALATGALNYTARLIWHDKSIHWMEGRGRVFYDEENQPVKMVGTIRDITKERVHQEELEESEQKFRLLADSMPQHVWTADPEGNLNYVNQSVFLYSGLSLQQLQEKGLMDIIHPDDKEENLKQWTHSIATGEDFLFEHRFRRHDGEYRWQLSRATPQKDAQGKIQMWVGTSTDIQNQKVFTSELERKVNERTKELKLVNEVLKRSEERYHLMVEEVQDYAIIYLNKEGIVENWNKGAEKIKGYKTEEIIGKSFTTFYTQSDKDTKLPQFLLEQATKNGRSRQEGWRIRKDGSLFWASVTITAVHNNDNEVIGFSKVTHDLTTKKEADDKIKLNSAILEQKNQELEKMNKELQSFAYISSHDLQEPLRKIQTFANQIIEKEYENLSEGGKDKFQRMQNAAKRMQTLINDLLAYSRTNTQERKFKKTALSQIMEEVKDDMREELQQHSAVLIADNLSDASIIPFQFQQLMYNLISNSLKFAKQTEAPQITITSEIAKGKDLDNEKLKKEHLYCHIRFSDNGIGFEQQYGEKIFEVFQRLHGKEQYQGTGIGLAIVKKIIDNHNGIITAKGQLGKGAQFDIYIPANNPVAVTAV